MTTTTNLNDPDGQATVPQVLALPCLFMAAHKLPHPKGLELRLAADKLVAVPHCGGIYSDCLCDYAEQLAGLFRDIAARLAVEPEFPVDEIALDMARRINRTEVSR